MSDIWKDIDNQLQHLLTEYNCKNIDDRIKLSNTNSALQNYFATNRIVMHVNNQGEWYNNIFREDYFVQGMRYANYDHFYIQHNPDGKLKNHIWIQQTHTGSQHVLDEIVLNTNYTIVSDTVDYPYRVSTDETQLAEVEYILYDKKPENIHTIRMSDFLAQRTILFRICMPSFTCLNERLHQYIENQFSDKCWEVRMDKHLCEKFLQDNFHVFIYYAYRLIYSATSRTDLLRHALLFKHGGCYLDISIRILSPEFFDVIKTHEFVSAKEKDDHSSLQTGILYLGHPQSILCKKFLLEILSGVLNEYVYENDCKSFLYNQQPSHDPFFYGPITVYKIYSDIGVGLSDTKILETVNQQIVNEERLEFESYSVDTQTETILLQVKYIGYYADIQESTKNAHYTTTYKNGMFYHSALNVFDKILIINLEHRTDRRAEIQNELNRFILERDKVVFIDAVYNKENGALGCIQSHQKCIEYAVVHNLTNVLILEDDCIFENIEQMNVSLMRFFMRDISWNVLLFGFSEYGPPVSVKTDVPGLYQNLWSQSTSAYAIHQSFYHTQLDNIHRNIENALGPYDFYWNENRNRQTWYIIQNTLGYQRPSYSDIENQYVDYKLCYESFLYI